MVERMVSLSVGIMLATFGTFWGGEGLGIAWLGEDLFLLVLVAFYLAVAGALILWLRPYAPVKAKAAPGAQELSQPAQEEVAG
jgi:uncharacterized membrane protein